MRFSKYLKEDVIKTAINIEEPKIGRKYSDKLVTKRIDIIQSAIKKLEGQVDDESTEAVMADLEDKRGKWSNVDKETKAPKAVEPPAEPGEGEEPPPEGEEKEKEEEPAAADKEKEEEEEDEKDQEKVDKEKENQDIDKEDRDKKREDTRDKNADAREKAKEKKKAEKEKVKENRAINRIIKSRIKLV